MDIGRRCIFFYSCPSIDAKDIYSGKLEVILSLIWTLIQHFQIYGHLEIEPLLAWINAQIPDQHVKNFTTDWNDGVALCALVEYIQPSLCPKYATLDRKEKLNNCKKGIRLAENKLRPRVKRILEPDELCDPEVDEHCVVTYISSFCKPANGLLLKWIQGLLPNRNIKNLGTDWKDGENLACLLNTLLPDLFPKREELNLMQVMKVGEERTGIKPPPKLADGNIDELSMSTYLAQFWHARSIPSDVRCTGHGLTKAFAGQPATFEINATKIGLKSSDFNVSILDSKSESIEQHIKSIDESYQVEYITWSAGKLEIDIKVKGFAIRATPFYVEVIGTSPAISLKVKDQYAKVGSPILMEVQGISKDRNLDISLQDMSRDTVLRADGIVQTNEGIVECSFKTTQAGKYKIVAKYLGFEIPGSPFEVEIVDPTQYSIKMCKPTSRLTVNEQSTFAITPSHANFSFLSAKVHTPGDSEPTLINLTQQNGSIIGKFIPTKAGSYNVVVTCAGDKISGSPIHFTAFDSEARLPRFVQVNSPHLMSLNTKEAGPSSVKVSSSQTDVLTIRGESDVDNQVYSIKFIPKKVGESTVDVTVNGISLVQNPPHTVFVCDASRCVASGTVLQSGCAKCNEEFKVTVQTEGAGKGELTGRLERGPQTTYPLTPEANSDGTYHFSLTPYDAGMHSLSILWGGFHIPNSPYKVKVSSDADQYSAYGEGLKEAVARKTANFMLVGPQSGLVKEGMLQVCIKDARYKSKMVTSKEEFDRSSEKSLVYYVTDNEKGSYSIDYRVPDHGNYTLHITVDGKSIPNSPFHIRVHPAFDPTKCNVFGRAIEDSYSIVLGKSIEFKVDTTEAGNGKLTAKVTGPRTTSPLVTITEEKKSNYSKRIYDVKIDPEEIGEYKVDLFWKEELIPGSPFSFEVGDPTKVKVLNLPVASAYIAQVNKTLQFVVDSKTAGKGKLECTVKTSSIEDGRSHDNVMTIKPKLQDDMTHLFDYTPNKAGQMQLCLTYNGENILPSTWECEIANPVPTQVIPLIRNLYGKQNEHIRFIVSGLARNKEKNMKITVFHPQHKDLKVQKAKNHESSTVYHFIPQHLGEYEVSVKVDSRDIHGSPFHVKIVNPDACIVQEDIPTAIYPSQNKQFLIETSEAGPSEFTFDTDDLSTSPILSFEFNSKHPGKTLVDVRGLEPGKCKVFLKWGGYEIPKMPVEITVFDPQQSHFSCEQIKAGNIKTTDRVSLAINTTAVGSCKPTVLAEGPTQTYSVEIEEIESGKYKASFTPQEHGSQMVKIFVGDVMLSNCPLKFETLDEKITPEGSVEMQETDYGSEDTSKHLDKYNEQEDEPLSEEIVTPEHSTDQSESKDEQHHQASDESTTDEIEHKPITDQQTKEVHTQTNITYKVKQEIQVGVPFIIGVDTKDKEKTDLRLRVVDPSKEHKVEIEEKPEEWRATYTALEKGGQELQVFCGDSDIEISGTPIKIFASNGKRSVTNHWKTAFFILVATVLLPFLLLVVIMLGFHVTDPTERPI